MPTQVAEPGSQGAALASQAAAQASVTDAVSNPTAQAITGATAGVASTTPGAIGVTVGQNIGFSAAGNISTQTPELPGIAWLVTFCYQGLKHSRFVNQDRAKWWLLPVLAFIIGFGLFWLTVPNHDIFLAAAQALKNTGLAAVNAATNYHTAKPLGIFSSAAEMGEPA